MKTLWYWHKSNFLPLVSTPFTFTSDPMSPRTGLLNTETVAQKSKMYAS